MPNSASCDAACALYAACRSEDYEDINSKLKAKAAGLGGAGAGSQPIGSLQDYRKTMELGRFPHSLSRSRLAPHQLYAPQSSFVDTVH